MNKKIKISAVALCTVAFCGTTFAAPPRHHREENDGLRLATGIVRLVQSVIAPRSVVISQPVPPPPPPAPVVIPQPAPPPPPPAPVVIHRPAPPPVIYAPPARPHRPPMHHGGNRPAPPPPKGGRR